MASIEHLRSLPGLGIADLNATQTPTARRFVKGDGSDIIEPAFQIRKNITLCAGSTYLAGLRRRKLAQHRHENRILSMRDAGDLHERVQLLRIHVSGELTERGFGLHQFRVDETLDDNFGVRRYDQIHGLCFGHRHRLAGQSTRHGILVHAR